MKQNPFIRGGPNMKNLMALSLLTAVATFATPAIAWDSAIFTEDRVESVADIQASPVEDKLITAVSFSDDGIGFAAMETLPDHPIQLSDSELAHIYGTGFEFCCSGGVCPVCFTRFTPPVFKP
jgi:hypothetical protein